ncbi:hypothetical protein [Dactylosporangium sp. CA-139066]|uniref:hypothetical protein n=1 Tax=Dactylosporangium sp. CA-139066 TaxID=3239930 RepID=UPI003D920E55
MAVVCLATVVVGIVRISAAQREAASAREEADAAHRAAMAAQGATASADAVQSQTQKDLEAARQARVVVDPTRMQVAFRAIGERSMTLENATCQSTNVCDHRKTVTIVLGRCGDRICVSASSWPEVESSAAEPYGDAWRANGTVTAGAIVCNLGSTVPVDDVTWTFTATVTAAQYSIAGGWVPTALDVTFAIDIPRGTCSSGTAQWKKSVTL